MLKIENAEGTVLAFLNNLSDAKTHEVLNGEYTLSFIATIDHLKTDFLYDENNLITCNNDLFRPVTIEEIHDEDDQLTVEVTCEHLSYDLIKNVMNDFNHIYASAVEVMTLCLLGTGFSLRSCNITKKTDIQYTEECNSKQISIAIANNWHGELKYYRHYVDLVKNRGQNRGTGFIFGKNLRSVKRIINRADHTVSYEVEIVQGSELEELGYYELGDTVRVMDQRMNLDYECKIIEVEKDLLTGINSKVVLGDAIKDMRSSFSSVKKGIEQVKQEAQSYTDSVKEYVDIKSVNWNKINNILDQNDSIIIGKLNTLTQIATKIINSTGTYIQQDNCCMWQDQPTFEASSFATLWSAQGLLFANSKKNNNTEWDWQTALGADGLIANSVTSSCVEALTASISTAVITNLTADTITGLSISGSTISGSTIVSGTVESGTYILLDKEGNIYGYKGGVPVLSIEVQNKTNPLIQIKRQNGTGYMIIGPNWFDNKDAFGINCYGGDLFIDTNSKIHFIASEVEFSCDKVKFYGNIEDKYGDTVTGSPN